MGGGDQQEPQFVCFLYDLFLGLSALPYILWCIGKDFVFSLIHSVAVASQSMGGFHISRPCFLSCSV